MALALVVLRVHIEHIVCEAERMNEDRKTFDITINRHINRLGYSRFIYRIYIENSRISHSLSVLNEDQCNES